MSARQIDFDKLAEIANFKNKASAQACFGPVKKKLMSTDGVVATPSKGGKRAAPTDGEGDDNPTPTKKPRARAKKVQPAPAAVETGDAEI